MIASFKPWPVWGCHHVWQQTGAPYVVYTTAHIEIPPAPPAWAPLFAECRCLCCGGYSQQLIARDTRN